MGFLDGVKNFVQKNILDKTTIDEQLGNAFNTAKSNLSAWAKPQVRQDFSREVIQQPVTNFAQTKVIDPATKLKNRVSSIVGGSFNNARDFINRNTVFADPNSNNGDNYWGTGRGVQQAQRRQYQGGGWGKEVANATPLGVFNRGGFLDSLTRANKAYQPMWSELSRNRDAVNNYIDSKPNARWFGQNIVKPAANSLISTADRISQLNNQFGDAYQDIAHNTDGNRNLVANIPKIGMSMWNATAIPKTIIVDALNAISPTDFTKGLTAGTGNIITGTELLGNNGGDSFQGQAGRLIGNIAGWRYNPANKFIGDKMNSIMPYKNIVDPKTGQVIKQATQWFANPVKNYLATRSLRGIVEQLPESFANIDQNASIAKNAADFAKSEFFGAGAEVVSDKAFDLGGKALGRVWNGSKPAREAVKKAYYDVRGQGGKWAKKTIDSITYPGLTPEQIAKVKLLENPKAPGKGLFPSERAVVEQWAETARQNRLKKQGGFINFGVLEDAGKEGLEKVKNAVNPKKVENLPRDSKSIMSELAGLTRKLKQYDVEIATKKDLASKGEGFFDDNYFKEMSKTRKEITDQIKRVEREWNVNPQNNRGEGYGKWIKDITRKEEVKKLTDNGVDEFEANFSTDTQRKKLLSGIFEKTTSPKAPEPKMRTVEDMSTQEKSDIFNKPEVKVEPQNKVQELVNYARKRGYQDKQIATMLRNKGYDVSGTDLKGQPTTIASVFANRKKSFAETLKPTADEQTPRLLTNRPEPDASEIAKSDANFEAIKQAELNKKPEVNLDQKAEASDAMRSGVMENGKITWDKTPQTDVGKITEKWGKQPKPPKERVELTGDQIKEQMWKMRKTLEVWAGRIQQGKQLSTKNARQFEGAPAKLRDEIINARENPDLKVSPDAQKYAGQFGRAFDQLFKIAKKYGVDVNFKDDFFTHIWDDASIEKMTKDGVMGRSVSGNPYFTKAQKLTWQEGLDKGLTPRYQTAQEAFEDYSNRLYKSIANKELINGWKNGKLAFDTQVGYQYKPVAISGYHNAVEDSNVIYLPRELADIAQKIFNPKKAEAGWEKTLETTAKVGKGMTQTILSGGYRTFNAMGLGKLLFKELPSGNFKAFKRFGQSMVKGGEDAIYNDIASDVLKYQKWGINLHVGKEGVKDYISNKNIYRSLPEKLAKAFKDNMESPTFDYFIPATQVDFARSIERQAVKQGLGEEQVKEVVRQAMKNHYDIGSSLDDMLKNKNLHNLLDTVFFAKTLRKSTIMSSGVNTIKGLAKPFALENQGNMKQLVGTILGLATLNAINKGSTGNNMWENPDGWNYAYIKYGEDEEGKAKYFRLNTTSIEYTWLNQLVKGVSGIVNGDGKQVASTAKQTLQFGTKSLVDLITNTDWKMDKIWEKTDSLGDKFKKAGAYTVNQNAHPVIKAIKNLKNNPDDDQKWEKLMGDLGEFPGAFKDEKQYKTAVYYDNEKDRLSKLLPEDRAIYEKMKQKTDDFGQKQRDKVAEAYDMLNHPEVMKAKRDIAIATAKKNGQSLDPLYNLSDDQLTKYYQIQGLANNDAEQKKLKEKYADWYKPLTTARGAYFDELVRTGQMKPQVSDYPQPSADLQKKLDYYYSLPKGTGARSQFVKSNPDLVNYWDKIGEYKDKIREAFGMDKAEKTTYSSAGSSGSSSGWQKYYDDKDFFALVNKLNSGNKPTKSKLSDIKAILKVSDDASTRTKKIKEILSKNSKNFDKKITSITGSKAKM